MSLIQEFKAACETYRDQLLAGRLATAEEITECYPGGAKNDKKHLRGWARAYGLLLGLTRRVEIKDRQNDRTTAGKRAAVLDAIAETPEVVELVSRDADGAPRTLTAYQKGDVALRRIHGLNLQLAELVDAYAALTAHGAREDLELLVRVLDEQSYLQRVIVWIATTAGPRLPFGEDEVRPEVPAALADLSPLDFYLLAQAFQRVNVAPFAALESSTAPRTRPDWSVFWSGMEFETKTPTPVLMRDRGLLSLVATASEHARGRAEAEARAKAERKQGAA